MIFAIFAREPPVPTVRIPQTGFTPTGAVDGLTETPVRTEGDLDCNLKEMKLSDNQVRGERGVPDGKRDCTKGMRELDGRGGRSPQSESSLWLMWLIRGKVEAEGCCYG